MVASNMSGHIQKQLTRSLERILEEAHLSGELKLSGRKLKDFPKVGKAGAAKYNLQDTVIAGESSLFFPGISGVIPLFFSFHFLAERSKRERSKNHWLKYRFLHFVKFCLCFLILFVCCASLRRRRASYVTTNPRVQCSMD